MAEPLTAATVLLALASSLAGSSVQLGVSPGLGKVEQRLRTGSYLRTTQAAVERQHGAPPGSPRLPVPALRRWLRDPAVQALLASSSTNNAENTATQLVDQLLEHWRLKDPTAQDRRYADLMVAALVSEAASHVPGFADLVVQQALPEIVSGLAETTGEISQISEVLSGMSAQLDAVEKQTSAFGAIATQLDGVPEAAALFRAFMASYFRSVSGLRIGQIRHEQLLADLPGKISAKVTADLQEQQNFTECASILDALEIRSRRVAADAAFVAEGAARSIALDDGVYVHRERVQNRIEDRPPEHQRTLVVGEAGHGKTSLLWWAYEYLAPRYDLKLWIGHLFQGAAYLPR